MLLFFSLIILGLIFGSFGSVILFRLGALPNGETLKKFFIGRSECRNCHHTLGIQDLIPLRSFFSQKGKCRYCQAKLSRRYPILEIGTVVLFVMTGRIMIGNDQWILTDLWIKCSPMWYVMIGGRLLFIIALYDLKQYELHLTASLLFLLLSFFAQWGLGYNLREALQGTGIFFGVFLVIYVLGKGIAYLKYKKKAEGFGFGDVLLAGLLGSVLQIFISFSSIIERVYFFSSYLIIACLFSFILLSIYRKQTIPQTLPFLPGMIVAFILLILYGNQLIHFLLAL